MSLWNVWKLNLLIHRLLFKVYSGGPFVPFRALDLFHLMYLFALCLFDICMSKLTPPHPLVSMNNESNNNRSIKILFWNIRGLNSQEKWDAVRDKISESACQVLCLQETKRETFDYFYIKRFCPKPLDQFAFFPSVGASGGLLTVWNSSIFVGSIVQMNSYAITVKLVCKLDNKTFHVTNIYGPANPAQKLGFVTWLINLDSSEFDDWVLGGDFNLIRNPEKEQARWRHGRNEHV